MDTTMRLNRMLTPAPWSSRLNTSRPRLSVPARCCQDGPLNGGTVDQLLGGVRGDQFVEDAAEGDDHQDDQRGHGQRVAAVPRPGPPDLPRVALRPAHVWRTFGLR